MRAMPGLHVSTEDPTPPYEQLRRQFAELIAHGVLREQDRLPPLRQLASDLGLAVGTVARTYRELEIAGLVASRRGGGTRVAAGKGDAISTRQALLDVRASNFVSEAIRLGFTDDDIRAALDRAVRNSTGTGVG
jgi:GntR family transcriptional regulator